MKTARYIPAEKLKPFIKTFLIIESENGMQNRILPDTSIVIAFNIKGKVTVAEDEAIKSLPASAITGLRKSSRLIQYAKGSATLIVIFNEDGASSFFKQPIHELFGLSLSLNHLIDQQKLNDVEEQIAEATTNLHRISVVEQFLLGELKESRSDRLVVEAIQNIRLAKGDIRIKDLASNLHTSIDPLEKRFRKITGTSPKQFCSIVKLRHLIGRYSHTQNLTDAAHAAGYFDQSHFIKDFRLFTGQTPKDFFKSAAYW